MLTLGNRVERERSYHWAMVIVLVLYTSTWSPSPPRCRLASGPLTRSSLPHPAPLLLLLAIFFEQGFIPGYGLVNFPLPGATTGTLLHVHAVVFEEMGPQVVGPPEGSLYSIQSN